MISTIFNPFPEQINSLGEKPVGDSYHTWDKVLPFHHSSQPNLHYIHSSVLQWENDHLLYLT